MKQQTIRTRTLPNGLTLVIEPMPDVQSAAFSIMVPGGSIYDPPGSNGEAAVLCDLVVRGAGERDSRQLSNDLDNLGVQRHETAGAQHVSFAGATIADKLPETLRIYADIVLRPHIPEEEFGPAVTGIAQSLRSIEDEPRQKVIQELRRRTYPAPWGRPSDGTLEDLPNVTHAAVLGHYERCFRPNGAIVGVAGNVDADRIIGLIEDLFGEWGSQEDPVYHTAPGGPPRDHIRHDSTQTHIGIAYRSVPYRDPDYYAAWAAVDVLSGGMSSRLFTEVREKRGLVYNVYATLHTLRDDARVLCYAGTTAERANETLAVTLRELERLGEGIEPAELDRCKARSKSALVMQQESTGARASSLARDWYHLGRVRLLDEVHQAIDALDVPTILEYVHAHPARDFDILTIGPEPLEAGGR
ncbi:MAG: pitrilysin family protein [Planctomycetales bacterium]